MTKEIRINDSEYAQILQQAVSEIQTARTTVARQVNTTVNSVYWNIGKLLFDRNLESGYGSGVVKRLSVDLKEQFPDMANGTWGGAGEIALFGDLGVKGITKANAIEALLKHLGADREDTMAFGDAKIDIPMLEYCNVGIAMGSGGPEIKEMADYITDGVDEDGLYNAFVKFGLIEKE